VITVVYFTSSKGRCRVIVHVNYWIWNLIHKRNRVERSNMQKSTKYVRFA